ncbi:ribosome biogenesis GTPase YqeH [Aquibacillus sp. 3ASR75-11]|uniref:Ribosome biogenesis GTPase YqeH n=1 Tax=Terrihalobacillus insolitus TaxID=2950438 RepID=A0A9X4ANU6_9BACI|nr:ribosome biogenesis GTPase YqeH [Terrihalobacillus insolitus]MDC3413315.1 ribosome biogenesis GTPase YqeH [Terrihalobacillus insolitus]MDC3424898.1 ribosome biogenesis GTPase YqeH [Terrihalobacillus insolitus]
MKAILCQGCGVEIQTENPDKPGFVPGAALKSDTVICKRCFRLKHYNEVQDVSYQDDDFLKMVSQIRNTKGLIIKLIDIFDFNGSFIKSLPRLTGDNPIVLVGNKVDLLPRSANLNKLKHWLKESAKEYGVKTEAVFLISAVTGNGMDELETSIEQLREGRDIYVVGSTNVGKSTFINQLINKTTGIENAITTSYFPGTTLGFIEIPMDKSSSLFDTPGVINRNQMAHYVSKQDLKIITPKKEIKPVVFQLNEGQTLFFGGLARLDFIKGEHQSFVCYFSNALKIHRTKIENADELYKRQVGSLLSPPNEETLQDFPALRSSTHKVSSEKTDVVFPGLGWVTISTSGATINAHSPVGVSISLRKSLI